MNNGIVQNFYVSSMNIRLFLFLIYFLPAAAKAQKIFSSFSFQQGLHSYNIQKTLQDKSGFLWVATQDGLYRYNGHSFDVLKKERSERSLQENFIFDICSGPDDSIYASVFPSGISIINTRNLHTRKVEAGLRKLSPGPSLSDNWVQKMAYTSNGLLWAGSDNCIFIIDQKKNT